MSAVSRVLLLLFLFGCTEIGGQSGAVMPGLKCTKLALMGYAALWACELPDRTCYVADNYNGSGVHCGD